MKRDLKRCSTCEEELSLDEFHQRRQRTRRPDGRTYIWVGQQAECKRCVKARTAAMFELRLEFPDAYQRLFEEHRYGHVPQGAEQ
jgi:hypothetical protein